MGNVKKGDRVNDADIRKLNHVGLGLRAIAKRLGCHPATVTVRLQELDVKPTDTRRNFMEDVFNSLDANEQEWLADNLYNSGTPVKEFVSRMFKEAYRIAPQAPRAATTPLPQMDSATQTYRATQGGTEESLKPPVKSIFDES